MRSRAKTSPAPVFLRTLFPKRTPLAGRDEVLSLAPVPKTGWFACFIRSEDTGHHQYPISLRRYPHYQSSAEGEQR
jgi:hypothetical protein